MTNIEKTLSQKYHFKGKIMNLREDEVELCGRKTTREVCEHCDGVAILPFTDDGEIVLVSQYRYPFELEILGFRLSFTGMYDGKNTFISCNGTSRGTGASG